MEIICSAAGIFSSIIGLQKFDKNLCFKPNEFCIVKEVDGFFAIYNTFNGMVIVLTPNEFSNFKAGCLESKVSIQLAENWFLVPEDVVIAKIYKDFKNTVLHVFNTGKYKSYTILPTTDCNARCFYCYERNIQKQTMTIEKADEIADFILKNSQKTKIELNWFGGEPLYNKQAIDIICKRLINNQLEFKSHMISNGLLFDNKTIKDAKDIWNLKRVQITLDGTQDNYNNTKAYIYKDILNPFNMVIDNIEQLLNAKIKVVIRLNVSKSNINDLFELVKLLSEMFNSNKYVFVYTAVLYDLRSGIKYNTEQNNEFINQINLLNEFIFTSGLNNYKISNTHFALNNCMADNSNAILISPDGNLHKCEHISENTKVGNISHGITEIEQIKFWEKEVFFDECEKCCYFPICNHLAGCENAKDGCGKNKQILMHSEYDRYIYNTVKQYFAKEHSKSFIKH